MTRPRPGNELLLSPYFLFNAILGIFLFGLLIYFLASSLFGMPALQCFHKTAFGRECPGCGLTRSTWALLQGDATKALQIHAGGLWIGGFFCLQLFLRGSAMAANYFYPSFAENMLWKIDAFISLVLLFLCFGKGYSFF